MPKTMNRRAFRYGLSAAVLLGGAWLLYQHYYQSRYPYGWSHCCDKQLWFALRQYADEHGGSYPSGGPTPEASLGLLYPEYADANLLRGKTVPEAVVQAAFDRGEPLGPETCGWQYVEGLRTDDDHKLALFWDKAGLGHNGERLPVEGNWVYFVDGDNKFVPAAGWAGFLAEQRQLLKARRKPAQ